MPDIALIPPYSRISDLHNRKLQMLLPTCLETIHFSQYMHEIEKSSDVLLDNGLFEEGDARSNMYLLDLALAARATEIVVPDVAGDGPGTLEAVKKFLEVYEVRKRSLPVGADRFENIKFMFVIQGANWKERKELMKALAEIIPNQRSVIGFPRKLTTEDPHTRLDIMETVLDEYGDRYKLHMLGLSREWPGELLRAARQFGRHLRGLDTSAPYTFAYNNARIEQTWSANGERPTNYFLQPSHRFGDLLVAYNTYILESWASGAMAATKRDWEEMYGV